MVKRTLSHLKSNLRKIIAAISLTLATVSAGAEHVSGINTTQMQGFRQQVQGNAVKFAVNSGVRVAFGEKPRNVLKSGAANFAADVASGLASNEISDWRQGSIGNDSLFDYTLHKGLHFATGAVTRGGAEALMGGNSSAVHRAALSGGNFGRLSVSLRRLYKRARSITLGLFSPQFFILIGLDNRGKCNMRINLHVVTDLSSLEASGKIYSQ